MCASEWKSRDKFVLVKGGKSGGDKNGDAGPKYKSI